ncbi:Uncharacterised protein [Mycobacteroides abscessus subsp. abscessus]|nr:Uncharacterised protein [Mycobacteroides abscessus subsp. abscessus]
MGVGHHPSAHLGQGVDDAVDRFFIPGHQRRRQDDQIVRGQRDLAVITTRHPRQCGHRLALGAGGYQYNPLRCKLIRGLDIDEVTIVNL